jgi:uncharacterized circularly permuted ATP-grasp superfamily protein
LDLFSQYHEVCKRGGYLSAYDELFADVGGQYSRPQYQALFDRLRSLTPQDLANRVMLSDATLVNQGITFTVYGDPRDTERTIPVDLIPRILTQSEWSYIERGLIQRVHALNLFLSDLYCPPEGGPRILRDKIVPPEIIETAAHYRRAFIGLPAPADIYVHICGSDLIRGNDGNWYVLEDNLRTPSGVSYVLANRTILTRVFPQLFNKYAVRPVDHYSTTLLNNLRALSRRANPVVVLLTPGVFNSAYFEHAFLAQQMGIELVQGQDLFVDDDRVFMRTTRGPQRVDVIYRRIDDDFLDPEVFRADSMLGVPGLMRAYAKGNVALANTVGTGVADDKVVYRYVPDLIRYYLDEDAILPNVPTYCGWDDSERDFMLQNLDTLVVKAANESGGYGMLIGPQATQADLAAFGDKIRANPRNYLAQPVVELSTAPTFVNKLYMAPRRVDLRPYILSGPNGVTIIPGGLTRVALNEGSYVVNSSQGGGSKDTWVLADTPGETHQRMGSMEQTLGGGMTQTMGSMTQTFKPLGEK